MYMYVDSYLVQQHLDIRNAKVAVDFVFYSQYFL